MEEKLTLSQRTIDGLNNIIRNYIKFNNMQTFYDEMHKKCITIMLNQHDIFCQNNEERLSSRKFVSFLLWSCIDVCTEIINNNGWKIPMNLVEDEFNKLKKIPNLSANNEAIGSSIFLRSIIKFIGQYTNNGIIYNQCCAIIHNMFEFPDKTISSRHIEHLFAFNKNFRPKYTLVPEKIPGSNRLQQFKSNGLYDNNNKECSSQYRKLRSDIAKNIFLEEEKLSSCLYFIECMYYIFFDKMIDIRFFLKYISWGMEDKKKKQIGITIKKILKIYDEKLIGINPDPMLIENEFIIRKTVDNAINEKMMLFDFDQNGQNQEEINQIIHNAVKINDFSFEKKEDYLTCLNIRMFKKLYHTGIIEPFSIYSYHALSLSIFYNIKWMQLFIYSEMLAYHNKHQTHKDELIKIENSIFSNKRINIIQ